MVQPQAPIDYTYFTHTIPRLHLNILTSYYRSSSSEGTAPRRLTIQISYWTEHPLIPSNSIDLRFSVGAELNHSPIKAATGWPRTTSLLRLFDNGPKCSYIWSDMHLDCDMSLSDYRFLLQSFPFTLIDPALKLETVTCRLPLFLLIRLT